MKPVLLAFVAALSIAVLRAEPVFEGYMVTADRPLFMLSDGKGQKSGWLTLGQTFENFTLIALQPAEDSLLVEKDGKRQLLKLRQGTILASKPESLETRLRALTGLALANELLKYEDKLTNPDDKAAAANLRMLLKRYDEALAYPQTEPGSAEAMKFLRSMIDRMSANLIPPVLAAASKSRP